MVLIGIVLYRFVSSLIYDHACYPLIQISFSRYLSDYNSIILHKLFFIISTTLCPNSSLLLHLSFRLLYHRLCWLLWLYDVITSAIAIAIAIHIVIAISITTATTGIAVMLLYCGTAFHRWLCLSLDWHLQRRYSEALLPWWSGCNTLYTPTSVCWQPWLKGL